MRTHKSDKLTLSAACKLLAIMSLVMICINIGAYMMATNIGRMYSSLSTMAMSFMFNVVNADLLFHETARNYNAKKMEEVLKLDEEAKVYAKSIGAADPESRIFDGFNTYREEILAYAKASQAGRLDS